MKKILLLLSIITGLSAQAQNDPPKPKSKIDLVNRSKDHFMIQFGSDTWTSRPDSVRTGGFSRHFNFYFMFDKPFKNNQKMSIGYGLGLGSSNMFFKNVNVDIRSTSSSLPFTIADSINHYNKFKLTSIYAEIPVELRYFSNPANPNKSWKFAIGAKIGTLLKAYTKGKNYVNKNGQSIYGTSIIEKEYSRKFINPTNVSITGRVVYGAFSLHGAYQVTGVLRDGSGANMNRISIGLTISGL